VDAEAVALFGADAMDEDRPDPLAVAAHVVVGLIAVLVDKSQLYPRCTGSPEPERRATVADMSAQD
jgi:hypothetical protein